MEVKPRNTTTGKTAGSRSPPSTFVEACDKTALISSTLFSTCSLLTLPLELCRCFSDSFLSRQITYRVGNRVYYWVWLRPDRLLCKTRKNTHTIRHALFGCTSRTVSDARELVSVFMCYSQGDGCNTSLSRLGHYNCHLSIGRSFVSVWCVWLCSVVRSCATQDDVNKCCVCILATSLEINRLPHPDHLAYTQSFGITKHAKR